MDDKSHMFKQLAEQHQPIKLNKLSFNLIGESYALCKYSGGVSLSKLFMMIDWYMIIVRYEPNYDYFYLLCIMQ